MAAGITLALFGLRDTRSQLPDSYVARVNEQLISEQQWQLAVQAVASDRKTSLSRADRSRILEQLINEELLLQHALNSGIVRNDSNLRGRLINAVLEQYRAQAETMPGSDEDLRFFYQNNAEYFAGQAQLRLRVLRFDDEESAQLLRQGQSMSIPADYLPAHKWRTYLGGSLSDALAKIPAGEKLSQPIALKNAWYRIEILDRRQPAAAEFEDVKTQVRAEWQRRKAETSIDQLLSSLKQTQTVVRRELAQ